VKSNEPSLENGKNDHLDAETLANLVTTVYREGVRKEIERHHRAGNPVAIWRDGQVVLLHPDGSVQPVNGTGEAEERG
jgi:hypothetical protein